jgi:glyoxalase family protein
MEPIQGIHHITAIASDPQRNVDFYVQVLGQRLVKKTVNFDDPFTYHLYYGDEVGSPSTIMTFFPWPHARRGRSGNGKVIASAYNIDRGSVAYWRARLERFGVRGLTVSERFGAEVIGFEDPDGMRLELITHEGLPAPAFWADGPVPAEHALRAFHGVTLGVADHAATAALLTERMGYRFVGQEGTRYRYQGASADHGQYVDLLVRADAGYGQPGAGSVHHVAFRVPDDAAELAYQRALYDSGVGVTDVKDRQYFHSIYFREPGGALFEIATDQPGFPVDEPVAELGRSVKLPPWLEPRREIIEQRLPKLTVSEVEM